MSGLGKTYLSRLLTRHEWFHYSVDYRIGTRYMGEHIVDNFKREAMKNPFSSPGKSSDIERLAAFVTGESRGVKMNVQLAHPEEKRVYALGQKMFFYRGGAYDFACATCHAVDGQRIRLQDLPNLMTEKGAQAAYTTWPAYRVSQGEVRTMQHRLYDCLRQQRFPEPAYGSDVITALSMFLAKNANGGTYDGPNMKR